MTTSGPPSTSASRRESCDRLLRLPPFLLSAQGGLSPGDIGDGLALTGHFLDRCLFSALNRPLPAARVWLVDKLTEAGRL